VAQQRDIPIHSDGGTLTIVAATGGALTTGIAVTHFSKDALPLDIVDLNVHEMRALRNHLDELLADK
jgi:hypothetical protein